MNVYFLRNVLHNYYCIEVNCKSVGRWEKGMERIQKLPLLRNALYTKHYKKTTILTAIGLALFLTFKIRRMERTPAELPESLIEKFANLSVDLAEDNQHLPADDRRVRNASAQTIIETQRNLITDSLKNYKFHPLIKVRHYKDLLIENGGEPVRNMVVATWRSGSTFLGDLLQSTPASFYHYEPLLPYGITQIRRKPNATNALEDLNKLMNCNYSNMDHYMQFAEDHNFLLMHNAPFWLACEDNLTVCRTPQFMETFCKLFPFQSIKTVRLRLNLTRSILQASKANVLYLIRDPRGTMQSRHHRDWCPGNPDCEDPAILCQDLVDDYHTAATLLKEFPNSFKVMRYEDLSLDVYNQSRILIDFFRLSYDDKIQDFLDSHTTVHKGGVSSTFRNSQKAPIHWKQDLQWIEIDDIQLVCTDAIKLWGYKFALDEHHLKTLNPVGKLKL